MQFLETHIHDGFFMLYGALIASNSQRIDMMREIAEDRAKFGSSERCALTGVYAISAGEMFAGVSTSQVHFLAVAKYRFVSIGGRPPDHDARPGFNGNAFDF